MMVTNRRDPAELPPLNNETPPIDAPVAIEWWHDYDEDGTPRLDTFHGFHDAERVAAGEPPTVTDGEIVTDSGEVATPDSESDSGARTIESHYLYMTHREALSRDISPCINCFPDYATDTRLAPEREDGGLLTESGVERAVFAVLIRTEIGSSWQVDSVHETYTSMLYRARAIRQQVGSAAERLRLSYTPIRRCEYDSFNDAIGFEPDMKHVSELREIQPNEIPTVRESVGEEVLRTPVEFEFRRSMDGATDPSVLHRADDRSCGYEREPLDGPLAEMTDEIRDALDTDPQTVEDVIERGNVVSFCPECFPKLAGWSSE